MNDLEACLVLNMLPKIGPVRFGRLLSRFGQPGLIFEARMADLLTVEGISPAIASILLGWQAHVDLAAELQRMELAGVKAFTTQSEHYPPLLREIYDPPIVLYCWGTIIERDRTALGVVGSRSSSHYGLESAKKLAYQLAYAGLTIVSGLARGIDTAAHQGALAAQGRTIAVLGCGLSTIYPAENYSLAERIAESGAVISEFPMSVTPDRQTFPMRNRIISGCSLGLLVVEAGASSGAIISANQALEQGRAVFSVPGQIDRPGSIGSNRLIQQGAKLVIDSADIISELGAQFAMGVRPPAPTAELRIQQLTLEEASVLQAVESAETSIDRIIQNCGLPTARVTSILCSLELKKAIRQLPGKQYVKVS
jgi:DNA processing protein